MTHVESSSHPPRGGRAGRRWFLVGLLGVLALVAAVYLPVINDYFGGDDFLVIGPVSEMGAWELIWRSFLFRDNIVYWRPLVSPIYALYVHGFGLTPWAYHLVVTALHLINVTLLVVTAATLTGRRGVALAAGLLFGVQAAHTTTVAQISSTVELLSALWYLTAVLCAIRWTQLRRVSEPGGGRRWYWSSMIAFVLALLSKESTASAAGVITVLFALTVYPPARDSRRLVSALAPFWALVIPYIVLTYLTDTSDPSGIVRQMYAPGAHIGRNLWWFAARLAAPLGVGQGPQVTAFGHLAAVVVVALAALALWRGGNQGRFLVLWTVIALLPLALWRPELLLGRFTYQAAAPFAVLTALGGARLVEQWRPAYRHNQAPQLGATLALVVAAVYGALTISQNRGRTREGELYRVLVTTLQRDFPTMPDQGEIALIDGVWSGPFHALYLEAVADTLYGRGNVRLINIDAGATAPAPAAAVHLRYDGAALRRQPP